MAINKRKILQSAQKHLQKGALDKALKDYQALLQADPRDLNVRLKIGDIHLKQGSTGEAVNAYFKVADRFMKDGFDAKAVALYKQITKIDPKRYDVYVPLAEVYQRLGLNSDAMQALQTAADAQYREGHRDEALDLLRKMAALDPSDTTSRLKVADLLRQEGRVREAVQEFQEVASELARQGDQEERLRVLDKIVELDPEQAGALVDIGRAQLAGGRKSDAEATARRLVELRGEDPEGFELLGEALEGGPRDAEATAAWRRASEIYRARGDEDRARDIMQRYVATDELTAEGEVPLFETAAPLSLDEPAADLEGAGGLDAAEALADAPPEVLHADDDTDDPIVLETPGSDAESSAAVDEPHAEASGAAAPEGTVADDDVDAEQLLAEAGVYLRYGKHERAVESLETILAARPDHAEALERLGDARAAAEDPEAAVEAYTRAAESARRTGDAAVLAEVRAKLEGLDPDAAAAFLEPGTAHEELILDDIDIEIDADDHEDAHADRASDDRNAFADETVADGRALAEQAMDEGGGPHVHEAAHGTDAAEAGITGSGDAATEDPFGDAEIEIDPGIEPPTAALEAEGLQAAPDLDDLEIDPGLDDSLAPGLDDSLASVGDGLGGDDATGEMALDLELDADADDREATGSGVSDAAAAPAPGGDEAWDLSETPTGDAPEAAEGSSGSATTPQQLIEDLEEADFYYQQEMFAEAREIYERVVAVAPHHPQAMLRLGEIEAAEGSAPASGPGHSDAGADDGDVAREAGSEDGALEGSLDELELESEAGAGPGAAQEVPDGGAPEAPPAASFREDAPSGEEAARGEAPSLDAVGDAREGDTASVPDDDAEASYSVGSDGGDVPFEDPGDADLDVAAAAALDVAADADAEGASDTDPGTSDAEAEPDASRHERLAAADAGRAAPSARAMADVTAPDYPVGGDDGGDFDLAAALSGALDTTGPVPPVAARAGTTEEEGFEQVFAAFKVGVERELGDGDHETHYDLGIAYREMGLVEDAIAEFRKALGASGRRLSALHMMSLCALDLGRVGDAVSHLEQALALPEVPEPQQAVLRYDLARAHEEQGDPARARAAYQAVLAHDPDFADAAERLAALADAPAVEAAAEPEEGLESFDGLVEEASTAEGGFESFDDLMADVAEEEEDGPAEAGTPEPDPQADPGPPASGPPDEPPDGGSGSGPRRGRRKKISFV